jgi:hypothetical protein
VSRLLRLLPALALAGCGYITLGDGIQGVVYRHTTTPLDVHLDVTPAFRDLSQEGEGNVKYISVHYFPVYIDIAWDSNAIGDIARARGIETVYYADEEVFSILGIWTQTTVHIYGKPFDQPPPQPTPPVPGAP